MKAESATVFGLKSGMDLVCLGGWGMWREEGGDCIVGQGDMVCVLCFVCFWCFFSFSLFFLSPFLFFFWLKNLTRTERVTAHYIQ